VIFDAQLLPFLWINRHDKIAHYIKNQNLPLHVGDYSGFVYRYRHHGHQQLSQAKSGVSRSQTSA
jgi:hypothetical protein